MKWMLVLIIPFSGLDGKLLCEAQAYQIMYSSSIPLPEGSVVQCVQDKKEMDDET